MFVSQYAKADNRWTVKGTSFPSCCYMSAVPAGLVLTIVLEKKAGYSFAFTRYILARTFPLIYSLLNT